MPYVAFLGSKPPADSENSSLSNAEVTVATGSAACADAGLVQEDEGSVAYDQRREQHIHSSVSVLLWTSVAVLPMHTRSPPVSGQRGFEPGQWREVPAAVGSPVLAQFVATPGRCSSWKQ